MNVLSVSNYKKLQINEKLDLDNLFKMEWMNTNNTKKDICNSLNISIKLADYIINKYNIQRKCKGPKPTIDKLSKYFSKDEELNLLSSIKKEYIENNLTLTEVANKLNLKQHVLTKFIQKYNIKKNRQLITETYRRHSLEKRGVIHSSLDKIVQEKTKQTCLEKYGVENISQCSEVKEKISNKLQNRSIEEKIITREKTKQTLLIKYGNENYNNRNKAKQSMIDKYGVEYCMQSEEIKNKYKLSIQKKYNKSKDELNEIDYMIAWRQQKHGINSSMYSDEFIINLLLDKSRLIDFIMSITEKNRNIYYLSNVLNLSIGYINLYLIKYNIKDLLIGKSSSLFEDDIYKCLLNLSFKNIKLHDRQLIYPLELDFTINNMAIEFNGNYYHSSFYKDKNYHYDKSRLCEEKGIRLIHIWEYEWVDKEMKIKLLNLISNTKIKIYARNCKIKEVSKKECDDFLNLYHLQNSCRGQKICYGLYYNNQLVQIMTFGKPRYNKNYEYELLRLCSHKDYKIVGGSERLFKHFLKEINPQSIISYCDYSKFSGEVYERLDMKLIKVSSPNKIWIRDNKIIRDSLLNQIGFDNLFGTNYGKGTSNEELMINHGWLETYDCGNKIYEWRKILHE